MLFAIGDMQFGNRRKIYWLRITQSAVHTRVGGGWSPLEEILAKFDHCRSKLFVKKKLCNREVLVFKNVIVTRFQLHLAVSYF